MADENFIDFDDIVLNYLPAIDSEIKWKSGKVKYNINRKYFHVTNEKISHDDVQAAKVNRTNTILFRSTYRNTTNKPMNYSIDQSRRTVTEVSCTIQKGIRYGGSFELEIQPPSIASLKLGLNNEVQIDKSSQESRQEEMSWTFQTNVPVPAQKAVTAELSVLEEHREGKFTIKSYFSGKILVDWEYKKKSGQVEITDLHDLCIGTERKRNLGFDKEGPTGKIYYETHGVCNCHYGLEQDVVIRETTLEEAESLQNK